MGPFILSSQVTKLKIQYNPYARAFEKGKNGCNNHKNEEESEDIYQETYYSSDAKFGEICHYPCPNDPYQTFTNGYPLPTEMNWIASDYASNNVDGHGGPIRSNFCSRPNGPYGVGFGPAKCS